MRWALGRIAMSSIVGALLLIMCAGYVGSQALLGAAVILLALGFVLLIGTVLKR